MTDEQIKKVFLSIADLIRMQRQDILYLRSMVAMLVEYVALSSGQPDAIRAKFREVGKQALTGDEGEQRQREVLQAMSELLHLGKNPNKPDA